VKPCSYVSYQTVDKPWTCTEIAESSNDPVWCHENDCRLSSELLKSDNPVCGICKMMSNILLQTFCAFCYLLTVLIVTVLCFDMVW